MEAMRAPEHRLLERIRNREATIGVVGLGYVGLPLAITFAEAGFSVLGLEVDRRKIASIESGESYINDIASQPLAKLTAPRRLKPTSDFRPPTHLDSIILFLPTP